MDRISLLQMVASWVEIMAFGIKLWELAPADLLGQSRLEDCQDLDYGDAKDLDLDWDYGGLGSLLVEENVDISLHNCNTNHIYLYINEKFNFD